ncbi:MAG: hypothetical protein KIG88_01625 [Weeksellaceae bacterium]|nr:hypothetical protein [Weeksellaceae bacterium]
MINYHLKRKEINKKQPVDAYLTGYFRNPSDRLKISVGKTINPTDFGDASNNFKFNRDKINKSKKHGVIIFKQMLQDFEAATSKTEAFFIALSVKPTKEEFKKQLLNNLGRTVDKEKISESILITDFIEEYLEECRKLVQNGQRKLTETSMKKYIQVNTHIKNYQEYLGQAISIDQFSYEMFVDFIKVINMIAIGKITLKRNHIKSRSKLLNSEGYSMNTLNTITSRLKFMLGEAKIRGYKLHETLHLNDTRLLVGGCPGAKNFYFHECLLKKIYDYEPKTKITQHAKDYIMLASSTGMRHESVSLLHGQELLNITTHTGENFKAVKNISNKTRIELLSPLFKPAQEVFERNSGFPIFDNLTTITRQIRKLLKEMKVEDEVVLKRTIFGVGILNETKKLQEVASTHVCRSSFITNLLNLRVDREKVKMMTHQGLNDGSAFSLYDKRSEVDRAIQFYEASKHLDSSFFTYK